MAEKSSVRITRAGRNVWDFLCYLLWPPPYTVVIDGEIVGEVSAAQEKTFNLSPGSHEVQMKGPLGRRSSKRSVTVESGHEAAFSCSTVWYTRISLR